MKIDLQKIANPYSMFAIAWALCLILYSTGWSDLFPAITLKLLVFLAIVIIFFAAISTLFNVIPACKPKSLVRVNYQTLLVINIVLYSLNFAYSGMPVLNGTRDDDFGIPTLIVFATTLNCFTSVYCFYVFLITGRKISLIFSLLCLLLFMMAFSRGNIMMSLLTMFFLWINVKQPILTSGKIFSITGALLLVMLIFGIAGNYRTINELSTKDVAFDTSYNSEIILNIGGASESFRANFVPDEFFWSYLYLTSPLSNLQYNINIRSPDITLSGVFYLIIDELMFDTVSKRIDAILDRKRAEADLLVDQLTVPTALSGSYNYAGWWGIVLYLVVLVLFPFVYVLIVLNNPLRVIGISTLCTIYFFSIFDNMLILTGLTLQIFFPVLLNFIDRINFTKQQISSTDMQLPLP